MSRRNIGSEILEGIAEIKQFTRGQSGLRSSELSKSSAPEVFIDTHKTGTGMQSEQSQEAKP